MLLLSPSGFSGNTDRYIGRYAMPAAIKLTSGDDKARKSSIVGYSRPKEEIPKRDKKQKRRGFVSRRGGN